MENVINRFIGEMPMFKDVSIVRGLYLRMDCTELFILESREWKNQRRTFVFEFDCGHFVSCKTEINTMEKYLMDVPNAHYVEYTSHI
jgi:hypothetical protein